MSPFLILVSIQTISVVIVFLVLRVLLEKMLLDMGCLKFELWKFFDKNDDVIAPPPIKSVQVIACKNLGSKHKQRVLKRALDLFGSECKVNFGLDKGIMGGIMIKFDENIIDCSLRGRLKQTGFIK